MAMSSQVEPSIQQEPNPFSRTAELVIDPLSTELGSTASKLAQDITESSSRFSGAKIGSWQATGDVVAVRQGTYRGKRTLLVAFHFRYAPDLGATDRITRADIEISFLPSGGNESQNGDADLIRPTVWECRPRRINTLPIIVHTVESREKRSYTGSGMMTPGLQGLALGAQAAITASKRVERAFDEAHAVSVEGTPKQSRQSVRENGPDDTALWRIRENEAIKKGFPREVDVAVVVELPSGEDKLVAVVKTTAQMSSGVGRFGLLWTKASPLRISGAPEAEFGPVPRTDRFDELAEDDWGLFAGIRNDDQESETVDRSA